MEIFYFYQNAEKIRRLLSRTGKIMKLFTLLFFVATLQISAKSYSQTVNLTASDITLKKAFKEIEKQTGYSFFINHQLLNDAKPVSLYLKNASINEALNACLKGQSLTYAIIDKTVILKAKEFSNAASFKSEIVDHRITGTVTDSSTGQPLSGVTVKIIGKNIGTVTDAQGRFSLDVSDGSVLEVSYLGYTKKEFSVDGKITFNIVLATAAKRLNQLVIVGYGMQKKSEITSAISEVDARDLKNLPISTAGQMLEGRTSGVQVQEMNGAPGTAPSIQIRGISSINAGIDPLVIIDGIPVGNGIPNTLSPNEIEKITVLKDAASTSIYGARGSNGVILIQTNQARSSQLKVEYNVSGGYQYLPQSWRPKMLNATQYALYNKWRVEDANAANNTNNPLPNVFQDVLDNPQKYNNGKGTNWLDEFVREGNQASFQNHSLIISGGSKKIKGTFSGGYLNQNGILPNTDFKRYSLRTNVKGTFSNWFEAEANLGIAYTDNNTINTVGMWGLIMESVVASPLQSPYDKNGNLIPFLHSDAPGYFSFSNPIYQAKSETHNTVGRNINAGFSLDIQLIKGLHYKPQIYTRLFTQTVNTFIPTTIGNPAIGTTSNLMLGAPPFPNSATNQNSDVTNWGIDNLLTYNKEFGEHFFNILVGYTAQRQFGQLSSITGDDFPSDDHLNYLEASETSASVSDNTNYSLVAIFGRLNYNYKEKYLLELNFRREGSSRFGSSNKYGNFPSASIGWRISEENFYPKDFFMSEVKLRASYGKTGNSFIGDYDRLGTIISIPDVNNISSNYNYVLNNSVTIGKAQSSLGNPNLKWETSNQLDIGLNLGLLEGKYTFSIDYFHKVTNDMLFNVTIPQASGFSSMRVNAGKMLNRGWDIELTASAGKGNLILNSNLSLSLLQNKVLSLPSAIKRIVSTYNITEEGAPVGSLYGYIKEGLFMTQSQLDNPNLLGGPGARGLGAVIFKDVNGDGKIDGTDQTNIGNPHPRAVIGINEVLKYKNLSLSILSAGAFGYKILSENNEWMNSEKSRWNGTTKLLSAYRSPENPGAGVIPNPIYPGQHPHNSEWVESGNHVWVKNITIGYVIPSSLWNIHKYVSNLKFFVSIQNAFKVTNFSGWNPEVSSYGGGALSIGVDNYSYPVPRTYTIGASIDL